MYAQAKDGQFDLLLTAQLHADGGIIINCLTGVVVKHGFLSRGAEISEQYFQFHASLLGDQ